ncbi:hypothetical protein [Kineococcus sp. SYSU DK001]
MTPPAPAIKDNDTAIKDNDTAIKENPCSARAFSLIAEGWGTWASR